MMNMKRLISATILVSCILLPACASRTPDTVHTEKQSAREARIDALLQDVRRRLDAVNATAERSGEIGRAEVKAAIDELNRNHREAMEKLQKLRDATNTTWGGVNDELQRSLDRLKQAYERTKNVLPGDPGPASAPTPTR